MSNKIVQSLDWEIKETAVMCGGKVQEGYKGLQRTDTRDVLSIVKDSYTPTKNETFKNLVSEIEKLGNYKLKDYLEIKDGRKILCWLENVEKIKLCGWESKDYLVIGNSFDYTSSFFVGNSNTLIRCQNQFSRLHNGSNFRVLHSKGSTQKIQNFQNDFEKIQTESKLFYDIFESFGEVEIDNLHIEQLVKYLCNNEFEKDKKISKILDIKKQDLELCIKLETNKLGKNAFGLMNGVTYYTTHKISKGEKVFGNILGGGRKMNDIAWDFCGNLLMEKMDNLELLETENN
jgi:hypothetical protein